jgi:glutathione S-transferase
MCYFRYKSIPFIEKSMTLYDIERRALKNTGAKVMPIVHSPSGEWYQDTRVIIEHMESVFPYPPVFPSSPKKLFVSGLIEAWADDVSYYFFVFGL